MGEILAIKYIVVSVNKMRFKHYGCVSIHWSTFSYSKVFNFVVPLSRVNYCKKTFKFHMTVFWAILDPFFPYDSILTFSANPLHDVFNQPFPLINRKQSKRNCKLSFFSHYKSYMTIWPTLPYDGTLTVWVPPSKRHMIFERSLNGIAPLGTTWVVNY